VVGTEKGAGFILVGREGESYCGSSPLPMGSVSEGLITCDQLWSQNLNGKFQE
jgi:hypothetical protein